MSRLKRLICFTNVQNKKYKNDYNYNFYNNYHQKWISLESSNDIPTKRSGHESIVINNKMYLFGGVDDSNNFKNDLYEFDLDSHIWRKINYKNEAPNIRASFAMCKGYYDNTLLLCGGATVNNINKDLYEFNIKTSIWTKLYDDFTSFYGLSISLYKHSLLVFGGTKGTIYSNKLFEYNLITNKKREINTSGVLPTPRYKHQAIIINNYLYIIGGGSFKPTNNLIDIYKLDINYLNWEKINMIGKIPINRVAHTCQLDKDTNNIIMFGGFDTNLNRLNDYYFFDIRQNIWTDLNNNNNNIPSKRAFTSSVFYNNAFYITCGADHNRRFNDVWKFQLRFYPPSLTFICANIIKNIYNKHELDNLNIPEEIKLAILSINKHATKI